MFQTIDGLKLRIVPSTIVQLSAQIPNKDKKKVKRVVNSTSNSVKSAAFVQFLITLV